MANGFHLKESGSYSDEQIIEMVSKAQAMGISIGEGSPLDGLTLDQLNALVNASNRCAA
jgi:hypothetical protein